MYLKHKWQLNVYTCDTLVPYPLFFVKGYLVEKSSILGRIMSYQMQAQGRPSIKMIYQCVVGIWNNNIFYSFTVSHGQYVSNSPADLPMPSVKEQTLMWQGVGQPGYVGDSGIHSGATTQVQMWKLIN